MEFYLLLISFCFFFFSFIVTNNLPSSTTCSVTWRDFILIFHYGYRLSFSVFVTHSFSFTLFLLLCYCMRYIDTLLLSDSFVELFNFVHRVIIQCRKHAITHCTTPYTPCTPWCYRIYFYEKKKFSNAFSVYDVRITRNMNTMQNGKLLFYHKLENGKTGVYSERLC